MGVRGHHDKYDSGFTSRQGHCPQLRPVHRRPAGRRVRHPAALALHPVFPGALLSRRLPLPRRVPLHASEPVLPRRVSRNVLCHRVLPRPGYQIPPEKIGPLPHGPLRRSRHARHGQHHAHRRRSTLRARLGGSRAHEFRLRPLDAAMGRSGAAARPEHPGDRNHPLAPSGLRVHPRPGLLRRSRHLRHRDRRVYVPPLLCRVRLQGAARQRELLQAAGVRYPARWDHAGQRGQSLGGNVSQPAHQQAGLRAQAGQERRSVRHRVRVASARGLPFAAVENAPRQRFPRRNAVPPHGRAAVHRALLLAVPPRGRLVRLPPARALPPRVRAVLVLPRPLRCRKPQLRLRGAAGAGERRVLALSGRAHDALPRIVDDHVRVLQRLSHARAARGVRRQRVSPPRSDPLLPDNPRADRAAPFGLPIACHQRPDARDRNARHRANRRGPLAGQPESAPGPVHPALPSRGRHVSALAARTGNPLPAGEGPQTPPTCKRSSSYRRAP